MTLSDERKRFIANIANDEWTYDLPKHKTNAENDKEFATQEPIWKKIRDDYLATSESAEELHEFVKQHHWGEADDFLLLIENQACDRNTARLIFWLSGPEFFRRNFATREDAKYENKGWWDLIHRTAENMLNGKYKFEAMPDDYKENIRPNEYWEAEPHWEIHPLMYGQ
ncbi:DUF4274 domain-containing protein [bacterium]|nr:DUF4274 domain-containing protein [bacterium]